MVPNSTGYPGLPENLDWVAVKGLVLSYYIGETLLNMAFVIHIPYGNLIQTLNPVYPVYTHLGYLC